MCSLSRYLLIGGLTAMAVATVSGSDLIGWAAGAIAVGLAVAAGRRFPSLLGPSSCPLTIPEETAERPTAQDVSSPH